MEYIITDSRGNQIVLEPTLALYSVRDFTGKEMPGLAIDLIDITNKDDPVEYHSLTVSFGEFIGMKNCAYVDTNNCGFAEQLLKQGIATPTQFTKTSGFWEYPLWLFDEETLKTMGAEAYELYHSEYEKYMADKMPPADE